MTRYSQRDEQDFILGYFAGRATGYVVDVGAADGIVHSNSRALIEQGWSGLLIEANPAQYDKLVETYLNAGRVVLLCRAISACHEKKAFHMYPGRVSTSHAGRWDKMRGAYGDGKSRSVTCIPLKSALAAASSPARIDFLSIDTEGMDLDVLAGMDFEHYSVELICVETTVIPIPEFLPVLEPLGYSLVHTTVGNAFFAKVDTKSPSDNNT